MSLDEIVAAIEAVTADDVGALAAELLDPSKLSAAGVGGDHGRLPACARAGVAGARRRCVMADADLINVAVSGAAGRMGATVVPRGRGRA